MTAYLLRRLASGLLTLVVASVVVFSVLEILPGDPARLMLGFNATEDAVQALRVQMGLDQGLLVRYLHWAGGLLTLDFGRSYTYSVPVIDLIAERAAVSLPLALISLALSTVDCHSGRRLCRGPPRARRPTRSPWRHRSSALRFRISGSPCFSSMSSPSGCGWCRPAAFPAGAPASGRR